MNKSRALSLILGVTEALQHYSHTDALLAEQTQILRQKTQEVYDAIEDKQDAEQRADHEDTIQALLADA